MWDKLLIAHIPHLQESERDKVKEFHWSTKEDVKSEVLTAESYQAGEAI